MTELLRIRSEVLVLLEKARSAKQIKSSLEAEVDIVLPDGMEDSHLVSLLRREGLSTKIPIYHDADVGCRELPQDAVHRVRRCGDRRGVVRDGFLRVGILRGRLSAWAR